MPKLNKVQGRIIAELEILIAAAEENAAVKSSDILRRFENTGKAITRQTLKSDIGFLRSCGCEIKEAKQQSGTHYRLDLARSDSLENVRKRIKLLGCSDFESGGESGSNVAKLPHGIAKTVGKAIERGSKLQVTFKVGNRRSGVSPYALMSDGSDYYLLGMSDEHRRVIFVPVSKLGGARLLHEKAERPDSSFSYSEYLCRGFNIAVGICEHIELDFEENLCQSVIESFGCKAEDIRRHDGMCTASITATVSAEFFAHVLRFGGRLQIQSPKRIANEYRRFLRTSAELAASNA